MMRLHMRACGEVTPVFWREVAAVYLTRVSVRRPVTAGLLTGRPVSCNYIGTRYNHERLMWTRRTCPWTEKNVRPAGIVPAADSSNLSDPHGAGGR
jgi:hypothetical protein